MSTCIYSTNSTKRARIEGDTVLARSENDELKLKLRLMQCELTLTKRKVQGLDREISIMTKIIREVPPHVLRPYDHLDEMLWDHMCVVCSADFTLDMDAWGCHYCHNTTSFSGHSIEKK